MRLDQTPSKRPQRSDLSLWRTILKYDFAASFVVFLVALPLCMGIAQASGVPVAAGLITGIVGGILVGLFAGSPLQVSGPAAGLTVIVLDFVRQHGLPALGAVVLLAGAIQLIAGFLKLGPWFRAVSPAVIRGMLSGIGVLILASQFHLMVDDKPKENGIANLLTIPEAIYKGFRIPEVSLTESRGLRTSYLHRFSELHEHQEEIHELVAERVTDAPAEDEIEVERSLIAALVPRQAKLLEQIRTAVAELQATEVARDDTKGGRLMARDAAAAVAAGEAALEALRTTDLTTARQRQVAAAAALSRLLTDLKLHDWAAMIGLLTIAILIVWKSLLPQALRVVPGELVAVLTAAGLAYFLRLPVLYVEVPDSLADGIHLPSLLVLQDVPWQALIGAAFALAAVASAETLLCATAVDQLHQGPRTDYDRELVAQGAGNMVCGLLGGLPMTGVIVRSAANVRAGGMTRASAVLHGLWLLIFVALLAPLLRYIPTSCLAGLLVYTGWRLIDFAALRDLQRFGKTEVAIFVSTVVCIVVFDLLTGVIVGVALSSLKLLKTFSRLRIPLSVSRSGRKARLQLVGAASFVRLPQLAETLEQVPAGASLLIDCRRLTMLDHACMELLVNFARQHRSTGGEVTVNWDHLRPGLHRGSVPLDHFRQQMEPAPPEPLPGQAV